MSEQLLLFKWVDHPRERRSMAMKKSLFVVTMPTTITVVVEAADEDAAGNDALDAITTVFEKTLGVIKVVSDPKVTVVAGGKSKSSKDDEDEKPSKKSKKDDEDEDEPEEEEEDDGDGEEEEEEEEEDEKPVKKSKKTDEGAGQKKIKIKLKG